jgi:chorismate synthase
MLLRLLTSGESHGPALTAILEGIPSGLELDPTVLAHDMLRRRSGYGRGGRMKIENDQVEILGGVRFGKTLGSPVSMVIRNKDHDNWRKVMPVGPGEAGSDPADRAVTGPRPGHADLAGALKYGTYDARDILERASARETAARTAAGSIARQFLMRLGIEVTSATIAVGEVAASHPDDQRFGDLAALSPDVPFRCLDSEAVQLMMKAVDQAREAGDSVGGAFTVLARGVPAGLGSHVHWDRKLDGVLGQAIMSIPAVKAVSIGAGVSGAMALGSNHHDPIGWDESSHRFTRPTNRAGGLEGGISNGEMIRVTGYLKPLSTLSKPLPSTDLLTRKPLQAAVERTDTIPIVAAGVVGEAMVCMSLASECLRKFGGDSMTEVEHNCRGFLERLDTY